MADTNQRKFIVLGGGDVTVPPSNVVWVSAGGSDSTGVRGNASLPFLTFQAGLAVAQSGDQIRIGPGRFTVTADLVWPAITALSVVGSGCDGQSAGTELYRATSITMAPPATMLQLALVDIKIANGAGVPLIAFGTGSGGTYMVDGLHLQHVVLHSDSGTTAFAATCVADIAMDSVTLTKLLVVSTSAFSRMVDVAVTDPIAGPQSALFAWDSALPDAPSATPGRLYLQSFLAGTLSIGGQQQIEVDSASKVTAFENSAAFPLSVVGGNAPEIMFYGLVTTVDFTTVPLPDTATNIWIDFTGARVDTFAFACVGGATNKQFVNANGMSVVTSVTAGNEVDFFDYLANATPLGRYLTTGTGTITPAYWAAESANGPSPITVPFPFRARALPVSAVATAASIATGVVAVTASSVTDITVEHSAGGLNAATVYVVAYWV